MQVVHFTTATRGTSPYFDTIVEVRRQCHEPATRGHCFDDANADIRASGSFGATGGEEIFLLLTGFGGRDDRVDRGRLQLDLDSRPNTPPRLESATATVERGRLSISVMGQDPDADVIALKATFFRRGKQIDLNGDAVVDEQDQLIERLPASSNDVVVTWTEPLQPSPLAPFLLGAGVDEVAIWLLDEGREQSDPVRTTLTRIEEMRRLPDPIHRPISADGWTFEPLFD